MEQDQVSAYYEASPYVTAISSPAESPNLAAKRHRRKRVYGHLAVPDGTSKPWFSEEARDLMRLLTVDLSVCAFTSRPTKIILSVDGRRIEHTPDLKVERRAETAIVDVVQRRGRKVDPEVAEALRRICMRHGLVYRRVERETIYRQPRFDNACELLRFKSVHPDPEFSFRVVDLLHAPTASPRAAPSRTPLVAGISLSPACMRWLCVTSWPSSWESGCPAIPRSACSRMARCHDALRLPRGIRDRDRGGVLPVRRTHAQREPLAGVPPRRD